MASALTASPGGGVQRAATRAASGRNASELRCQHADCASPLDVTAIPVEYEAILRQLFRNYARGEYFSSAAAQHLGKVGRAVALWVLLDFLCEPLLGLWVSMNEPLGQRFFTLSLTPPSFVALFLAACIAVIARILWQASEVDSENRTFV